jgi:hypothetical protein
MVYPAKKDWWIRILVPLAAAMLLFAGFGIPLLLSAANAPAPPAPVFLLIGLAFVLEAVLGVVLLWAFFSSSYAITETDLVIRFGPFRWRIPLDSIAEVKPKRGLSSDFGWGLAWSLDRVLIRRRKANGRLALMAIAISPRDKATFVEELLQAAPGVVLRGGEAARVA